MSQVLIHVKQQNSLCSKLLQKTVAQCQFQICYCLFIASLLWTSKIKQAFVNHSGVLVDTEISPFGSHLGTKISEATETRQIISVTFSVVLLLCHL